MSIDDGVPTARVTVTRVPAAPVTVTPATGVTAVHENHERHERPAHHERHQRHERPAHDESAETFDAFVAARSRVLLRTAFLLTRDHALAEDLVQTALAKAWFQWSRIRADNPEPYVRRILVTTYSSWWRRRWNGEIPTADMPETPTPDGEDRLDLWDAIGRLPRRQRAVVVLRFYEDLSEAETARLMGSSVGTVKSQTAKALAKLRLDPSVATPAELETPR